MSSVMGALSAVFWGLVLLSVLVFVHEGGHYLAARAFGVRVTEFFLGLPSRFKVSRKSKRHGTEFGVTLFMLGGYNRICGMEGYEDDLMAPAFAIVQREGRVSAEALGHELGVDTDRAYALLIALTDLAAIRPFYDPDLGEYPTQGDYPASFETIARDANMLTEYDGAHDFSLPGSTGDAEPRPLADPQAQLACEVSHTYKGQSLPKRLVMLLAGPFVNILLAFLLTTGVYMATEFEMYENKNVIGTVTQGSIAEDAGLKAGDEILRVGDVETADWEDVSDALATMRQEGEDFSITYVRDGVESQAFVDMPEGQEVEYIGVTAPTVTYRPTLLESMRGSLNYTQMVLQMVARLLMPQHTMEVLEQSSSVVGISVQASEAASSGVQDMVALMAAVSMSLGFMNLLPIAPLDGGKILIELIQAITRRRLSMKVQTAISYVGLAFFVFVFVVAVRNDVLRLIVG